MRLLVVLGLVLLGAAPAAAEVAGRVLIAAGEVNASRGGLRVPLANGSAVEDADVLRTGPGSSLQVRFTDGAVVSLREKSEFAIEEYRFASGNSTGRAFFRLLKGGLRTVTGLIGRRQHEDYAIRTITATVGIRGTHFTLVSCAEGSCLKADGTPARDGLYGQVHEGAVAATTDREYRFSRGETFLAPAIGAPAQRLLGPLPFLSGHLEGQGRSTGRIASPGAAVSPAAQAGGTSTGAAVSPAAQTGGTSTGNTGSASNVGAGGGVAGAAISSGIDSGVQPLAGSVTDLLPYSITQNLTTGLISNLLPPANRYVVAYLYGGSSFDVSFDHNGVLGTFNAANQLLSYGSTGTYPAGSLLGATILDSGSFLTADGTLFTYGRWSGNFQVTTSDGTNYAGLPGLLFGTANVVPNMAKPTGGTATYTYRGGPSVIDAAGNLGSITSSSAQIDFGAASLSVSLGVHFGNVSGQAATFALTGSGNLYSSTGPYVSGSLTGSCSGAACGSNSASGVFYGGATGHVLGVEGLVLSGGFFGTSAGHAIFLAGYEATALSGITFGASIAGQVGLFAWSDVGTGLHSFAPIFTPLGALTINGSGVVTAYSLSTVTGTLGGGTALDTGSVGTVDSSLINWGRWAGAGVTVSNGSQTVHGPSSGVPYSYGAITSSLPPSGSFTYSLAGAPSPVTAAGVSGVFTSGSYAVDFSARTLAVATPLTLSMGASTYSLTSCVAACTFSTARFTTVLGGGCIGGACGGGMALTAATSNAFVGPQAGGLISSGVIIPSAGASPVVFSGAFKR